MDINTASMLAEQLDGARAVVGDPERGAVLVWFGGKGFNAWYLDTGQEIAHWNMMETPTVEEAVEDMREEMRSGEYIERG